MKVNSNQLIIALISISAVIIVLFSIFLLLPSSGEEAVVEQLIESVNVQALGGVKEMPDNFVYGSTTSQTVANWIAGLSILVALVSVALAVTAIRWRKALDGGQTSLLPSKVLDDWKDVAKRLGKQESSLREFSDSIHGNLSHAHSAQNETQQNYKNILNALRVFQEQLTKREQEIDRLRRGGDAEVFRRFLNRFLRLYRDMNTDLKELKENGKQTDLVEDHMHQLEDALFDTGLERFRPQLNSDFRSEQGIADNPATVETDDPELDFKVAEILKDGFLLQPL